MTVPAGTTRSRSFTVMLTAEVNLGDVRETEGRESLERWLKGGEQIAVESFEITDGHVANTSVHLAVPGRELAPATVAVPVLYTGPRFIPPAVPNAA